MDKKEKVKAISIEWSELGEVRCVERNQLFEGVSQTFAFQIN
jgi:hypothetical protein